MRKRRLPEGNSATQNICVDYRESSREIFTPQVPDSSSLAWQYSQLHAG